MPHTAGKVKKKPCGILVPHGVMVLTLVTFAGICALAFFILERCAGRYITTGFRRRSGI